ncbi:uncharacterized protein DS421_14g469150 [Arachis hypogaea]|nr:uncharacterized protein DS421_14g469150 [Arachis hypogaea]
MGEVPEGADAMRASAESSATRAAAGGSRRTQGMTERLCDASSGCSGNGHGGRSRSSSHREKSNSCQGERKKLVFDL